MCLASAAMSPTPPRAIAKPDLRRKAKGIARACKSRAIGAHERVDMLIKCALEKRCALVRIWTDGSDKKYAENLAAADFF